MSLISNFAKITEESQAEYASMKDAVLSRTDVLGDSCEGDESARRFAITHPL